MEKKLRREWGGGGERKEEEYRKKVRNKTKLWWRMRREGETEGKEMK